MDDGIHRFGVALDSEERARCKVDFTRSSLRRFNVPGAEVLPGATAFVISDQIANGCGHDQIFPDTADRIE